MNKYIEQIKEITLQSDDGTIYTFDENRLRKSDYDRISNITLRGVRGRMEGGDIPEVDLGVVTANLNDQTNELFKVYYGLGQNDSLDIFPLKTVNKITALIKLMSPLTQTPTETQPTTENKN